jgi:hypothetical protein
MAEYPALAIQSPNIVGNFLGGMQTAQDMQSQQLRNQLLQQQQAQQQAAMQRDEQFRNVLAQSVGPMAAGAAQGPGGDPNAANYLMQGTENPLGGGENFNELVQLDPERAFQFQAMLEQQQQQRMAQLRERAGVAVRSAEFVLKSKDPKRTLELGFPEMVEQLKSQGLELDDLDDDAVRAMAEDVVAQFGPIAGVGPAGPGDGFTLSQGQKRFDAQGREVASVAPAASDTDPNDKRFTRTQALRKEYESRVEGFEAIRSAYENVQNAEANDSGDTQLVLNFMRTISPGIRVQPGERIDDAASVPGIPQQVIGIWNKVVADGKLNGSQRAEIRSQAKRTFETQRRLATESRQRYAQLATTSGLEPGEVVGEDWKPVAEFDVDGRRTFDSEQDAERAGLKKGTRVVINGVAGTWE